MDADRFSTQPFHLPNLGHKSQLQISCNSTDGTLHRPGIRSGLGS